MANTLGDRICQLRTENKLTQQQLMSILNFDNLSKYEKNQREPKYSVLLALAKYFNVSVDWLLTGAESKTYQCSYKEEKLLNIYRQLSPLNQEKELARMETLVEVVKEETIIYKAVPLLGSSAAGTPIQALDQNEYQLLQTTKLKADFALSIKGHSMEPMITDGSIIFVHQTPHLENGEIGVFQINSTSFSTDEEVTCKIFKQLSPEHIQLLSVNSEYPTIDINPAEQGLKILGKVIL